MDGFTSAVIQRAPTRSTSRKTVSIVVPMFNEADGCEAFFDKIIPVLDSVEIDWEIVCINDGSRDGTYEALNAFHAADPRIKAVHLSRNFGKEAAMTAGLELAQGDAVIPIDADLQDPPELIVEMIDRWRAGAQVVLAKRSDRSSDSLLKRKTSQWYYALMGRLSRPAFPADVGDFRLMDRIVVDAVKRLPERTRYMKGILGWVGFRTETITFVRPERASGGSKFNYFKLWDLALEGLFSFSAMPLKVWSYVGVGLSLLSGVYIVVILTTTIIFGRDAPGYASLMSVILFFNGMILISLGALGEYLARVFIEVKGRPVYLVGELVGFEDGGA